MACSEDLGNFPASFPVGSILELLQRCFAIAPGVREDGIRRDFAKELVQFERFRIDQPHPCYSRITWIIERPLCKYLRLQYRYKAQSLNRQL